MTAHPTRFTMLLTLTCTACVGAKSTDSAPPGDSGPAEIEPTTISPVEGTYTLREPLALILDSNCLFIDGDLDDSQWEWSAVVHASEPVAKSSDLVVSRVTDDGFHVASAEHLSVAPGPLDENQCTWVLWDERVQDRVALCAQDAYELELDDGGTVTVTRETGIRTGDGCTIALGYNYTVGCTGSDLCDEWRISCPVGNESGDNGWPGVAYITQIFDCEAGASR